MKPGSGKTRSREALYLRPTGTDIPNHPNKDIFLACKHARLQAGQHLYLTLHNKETGLKMTTRSEKEVSHLNRELKHEIGK